VVVPVGGWPVAGPLERRRQPVRLGEVGHRDLHVDDVLGGQPGDRGGPDVVDADDLVAEVPSQPGRQLLELPGPGGVVVLDDDAGHALSVEPRRAG
jgi:hypothetical protein